MRRLLVVAGAMAVMLTGARALAHATKVTYSTTSSLDVERDDVVITQTDPSSSGEVKFRLVEIGGVIDELTSVPLDLALPSPNHDDASPQASITAATPPPSMLLLVGTGLTGLAGMVRRRLTRRNRIAW